MRTRFIAASSLIAAALPALAAGIAEPPGIAPQLRPAGEAPAFALKAAGVQIYKCSASADGYEYKWAFVAPEAMLSEDGAVVGHHTAGPTWESIGDGSVVKGSAKARQDGGAGNIPWLWLPTTSIGKPGRFADVTSVLRVATQGGVEPAGGCDAGRVGLEAKVPYTADYYFYKRVQ
ncbi:MAG TPA: DUF3455 domain-containing protein [Usitatibacter sp.]|jgi:hypothetical protein|nr:DUF3455 domain-containing protein [Usitatibacter sp.]